MSAVAIDGVAQRFGATLVLDDVSIVFEAGKLTSLLGPSGSGKTTLLRIVAGFLAPEAGSVRIGDKDVTMEPVWRRRIGFVFQSYALFPHMSVLENVMYGLERRGMSRRAAGGKAGAALDMVRLPGFADRKPASLSGGQQQRVALARAIVTKPTVLLLDEPLSALDRRLRQEMQVELLRIQRESGLTTVFVTHDQEEALALSDRVAILDRGRIIQSGAPAEIYEHPRTRFAAAFLGDANFLTGTVEGGAIRLGGGALIRAASALPGEGARVTVAVRPEKIVLASPGDATVGGANSLPSTVNAAIYSGAALTYGVTTPDGTAMKVFAQNFDGRILAAGARVTLCWPPAQTVLLDDEGP